MRTKSVSVSLILALVLLLVSFVMLPAVAVAGITPSVELVEIYYDDIECTSTWTYEVTFVGEHGLSHWVLGIPLCEPAPAVVSHSESVEFEWLGVGYDGSCGGFYGLKWETKDGYDLQSGTWAFSFTLDGQYKEGTGTLAMLKVGKDCNSVAVIPNANGYTGFICDTYPCNGSGTPEEPVPGINGWGAIATITLVAASATLLLRRKALAA